MDKKISELTELSSTANDDLFVVVDTSTGETKKIQATNMPGGGGVDTFLELTDTPNSYTSQTLKLVRVNAGATALEFFTGLDVFVPYTGASAGLDLGSNFLTTSGTVTGGGLGVVTGVIAASISNDIATINRDFQLPDNSGTFALVGDDHGSFGGLGDDDHTQYALLAGRSGGQTLIGGTASGDDLNFQTTSNATKGSYIFATGTIEFLGTESIFKIGRNLDGSTTRNNYLQWVNESNGNSRAKIAFESPTAINQVNNGLIISTDIGNIVFNPLVNLNLYDDKGFGFGNGGTTSADFTITYTSSAGQLEINPKSGLGVVATAIVFNEASVNGITIRMEGAADANAFVLDPSTDNIGIGVASPGSKLDVAGSFQCDSITNDTGLAHGVYTPTLTNGTNVDASTAYESQYARIGNTVIVSGKIDIDPTAGGAALTEVGVSLPIASNFGATEDCGGNIASGANSSRSGVVIADATNNRASINFASNFTSNQTLYYTFIYQVI